MKGLIVEDEKKIASFLRKGLESQGFVVDVTHHGGEGFTLAITRPYGETISGLVLVAFGAAAWALVSHQKLESVDTEIRSFGAWHRGWIATRGNYQRLDDALKFIFGDEHDNEIILLVKDANGAVLHTSAGWPEDLSPAQLDSILADDPKAMAAVSAGQEVPGAGLGRSRRVMGRGLGPGSGGVVATFTKIPRFQTATTARGEWRLGMLGTTGAWSCGWNWCRARLLSPLATPAWASRWWISRRFLSVSIEWLGKRVHGLTASAWA
jgi:hypothetical protein